MMRRVLAILDLFLAGLPEGEGSLEPIDPIADS